MKRSLSSTHNGFRARGRSTGSKQTQNYFVVSINNCQKRLKQTKKRLKTKYSKKYNNVNSESEKEVRKKKIDHKAWQKYFKSIHSFFLHDFYSCYSVGKKNNKKTAVSLCIYRSHPLFPSFTFSLSIAIDKMRKVLSHYCSLNPRSKNHLR